MVFTLIRAFLTNKYDYTVKSKPWKEYVYGKRSRKVNIAFLFLDLKQNLKKIYVMYDGSINWMPPGMILSRRIRLQPCSWRMLVTKYIGDRLGLIYFPYLRARIAQSPSYSSAGPGLSLVCGTLTSEWL